MKPYKYIASIVLLAVFLSACNSSYHYPKDADLSNADGFPNDSLAFYFPASDSGTFNKDAIRDSFSQNWYSSALYAFKEPILYNYYVGHDRYRFLYLRAFDRPLLFSLHKEGSRVWLRTKMLDRQPQFYPITYSGDPAADSFFRARGYSVVQVSPDEIRVEADRKANIIVDKKLELTPKEWREFEQLLERANFWTIASTLNNHGADGSEWIIEAHQKNRYHFIERWSPIGGVEQAGKYLVKLSGVREEIY